MHVFPISALRPNTAKQQKEHYKGCECNISKHIIFASESEVPPDSAGKSYHRRFHTWHGFQKPNLLKQFEMDPCCKKQIFPIRTKRSEDPKKSVALRTHTNIIDRHNFSIGNTISWLPKPRMVPENKFFSEGTEATQIWEKQIFPDEKQFFSILLS